MPDDRIRIIVNGRRARAPAATLEKMRASGVSFELADAPEQEEPETSVADIARGVARGALHGITFGLADHIPGTDFSPTEALGLAKYKEVEEATPVSAAVGDLASGFVLPGGALAKVAGKLGVSTGALGKLGLNLAQSGAEGGVRAATEGEDVASNAGLSVALGGAGAAVSKMGSAFFDSARKLLGHTSDATLARSVGVKGRQVKALSDGDPDATAAEVAAIVREVSPSTVLNPKSAGERSRELNTALENKYGPEVDRLIDKAQIPDSAARSSYGRVISQLLGEAGGAPVDTEQARAYARALYANADGMAQNAPTGARDFRQLKTAYNKAARPDGLSISDKAAGKAAGTQAQATDAALDDLMQRYAAPDVRAEFHRNNAEYSKRALVQGTAEAHAKLVATDSLAPEFANALAGAAVGGGGALIAGGDPGSAALTGLAGAGIAGATRSGLLKSLQGSRGLDRLSNISGSLSRGSGAVSDALGSFSGFAPGRRALANALSLEGEDDAP
jgi:hypothetical protein